jgi:hypothetical protein
MEKIQIRDSGWTSRIRNYGDTIKICKPIPESSKELQNGDQELSEGQTGGRRVGSVDDAAYRRPCKGGSQEFFNVSDVIAGICLF